MSPRNIILQSMVCLILSVVAIAEELVDTATGTATRLVNDSIPPTQRGVSADDKDKEVVFYFIVVLATIIGLVAMGLTLWMAHSYVNRKYRNKMAEETRDPAPV